MGPYNVWYGNRNRDFSIFRLFFSASLFLAPPCRLRYRSENKKKGVSTKKKKQNIEETCSFQFFTFCTIPYFGVICPESVPKAHKKSAQFVVSIQHNY